MLSQIRDDGSAQMTWCAVYYDVIYHPSIFEDAGGWQPCNLVLQTQAKRQNLKHEGKLGHKQTISDNPRDDYFLINQQTTSQHLMIRRKLISLDRERSLNSFILLSKI